MNKKLYKEVYEVLSCCPKIDIHTHLTANRLITCGLDDILLYHMVNSELYSSGCSQGERVPKDRSEEQDFGGIVFPWSNEADCGRKA